MRTVISSPGRRLVSAAAVAALAGSTLAVGTAAPASAAPIPTGSITGTVVGPDGAPIPGATIYLAGDRDGDGDYYGDADSFTGIATDGTGGYAFAHLPAGNYLVEFSALGHRPEYYNDATSPATATPVAVGTGNIAVPVVSLAAEAPSVVVDADTDVTGVVTDALTGKSLAGARVTAYNAATGAWVASTSTDVTGAYEFGTLDPAVPVKLEFYRYGAGALLGYRTIWSGGARTKGTAVPVAMTPGTPVTVPIALTPYAGFTGKVLNPAGQVPYGAYVEAYDADTNVASSASVRPDGTYYLGDLNAGETYRFKFSGFDFVGNDTANDTHYYLDSWYGGSNDFSNAAPVAAGAAGTFTPGIDATFGDSLVALEQPSISGDFAIGKTLTANPGRWNKNGGSTFTYEWLRGSTIAGTGATYELGSADAGSRISLRVTNTNVANGEERVATATVEGKIAKYAPKVRAKAKHGKLTIKLKTPGQKAKKVKGMVVVKQGKAKVGKAKVKKGTATLVLKGMFAKPGKHKFTIKYHGNKTTASFQKKVKVKVTR